MRDISRAVDDNDYEKLWPTFANETSLPFAAMTSLNDIRDWGFALLLRDDEYIAYMFNRVSKHPEDATDRESFYRLVQAGNAALSRKDFVELRRIIGGLLSLSGRTQDEFLSANVIKA